jgi:hypothetical protein
MTRRVSSKAGPVKKVHPEKPPAGTESVADGEPVVVADEQTAAAAEPGQAEEDVRSGVPAPVAEEKEPDAVAEAEPEAAEASEEPEKAIEPEAAEASEEPEEAIEPERDQPAAVMEEPEEAIEPERDQPAAVMAPEEPEPDAEMAFPDLDLASAPWVSVPASSMDSLTLPERSRHEADARRERRRRSAARLPALVSPVDIPEDAEGRIDFAVIRGGPDRDEPAPGESPAAAKPDDRVRRLLTLGSGWVAVVVLAAGLAVVFVVFSLLYR